MTPAFGTRDPVSSAPGGSRPILRWLAQFGFDSNTVRRIEARAPFLAPLMVATALNLATGLLMRPPLAGAVADQPAAVAQAVSLWWGLLILFYPAIASAKAVLLGAVSWAIAAVSGRAAAFSRLVSLFLYGEVLLLLPGFFTGVVLILRGPAGSRNPADLQVPWGIDLLIDVKSPVAVAAAQASTVFHVLWIAFLGFALSKLVPWSRAHAWMTALLLWVAIAAFRVLHLATAR